MPNIPFGFIKESDFLNLHTFLTNCIIIFIIIILYNNTNESENYEFLTSLSEIIVLVYFLVFSNSIRLSIVSSSIKTPSLNLRNKSFSKTEEYPICTYCNNSP